MARETDKLAGEELDHASLVRRWRRAACHNDQSHRRTRLRIGTIGELDSHLSQCEAEIAGCHRALAVRLDELGDHESAALLLSLLDEPSRAPGAAVTCHEVECQASDPVRLLAAAQKRLEALSEDLADMLETADAEVLSAAEQALNNVVGRLARLVQQIERRLKKP